MNKQNEPLQTIGEVATLLNIPQHVIRFWESKFPKISPKKLKGRRYYNSANITDLIKIKDLLYKEKLTIKGVQNYLQGKSSLINEQSNISNNQNIIIKLDLIKKEINNCKVKIFKLLS